jgi:uncharacterized protein YhbP (UPF0306 family)
LADVKYAKEILWKYLGEAKLMSIATVSGKHPWAASAWYVHDKDWNLYFLSRKSRRHSLEMKKNPNVAGTIVTPHVIGSGEKVRGVQFEGTARECNWEELKLGRELYTKKYPTAENIPLQMFRLVKFIATYYIIKPKKFVLYDEINFPKDPRQEIKVR